MAELKVERNIGDTLMNLKQTSNAMHIIASCVKTLRAMIYF